MGNQSSTDDDNSIGLGSHVKASMQAQALMRKMDLGPGVSYGVVGVDGSSHSPSVVYSGAVGTKDGLPPGPSEDMATDTMLMAYSITKIVTAGIVLRLSERGLLGIDDSVSKHLLQETMVSLPSDHYLESHEDDITLQMLLDHTSGVPNP